MLAGWSWRIDTLLAISREAQHTIPDTVTLQVASHVVDAGENSIEDGLEGTFNMQNL